ncbi:MAG TPA: ABC transporter permease [Armatimonadota bacterium]|nr:ABC transporter permease [Armatimonadota bacterium]
MIPWLRAPELKEDLITLLVIVCVLLSARALWVSPVWHDRMRRLWRSRAARVALAILAVYALFAVMDSIVWHNPPYGVTKSALDRVFERQSERTYSAPLAHQDFGVRNPRPLKTWHLLGTDGVGNDVLYDTLKGCRTAWIVGGFTLIISLPFAIVLGIVAGYFGGWIDDAVQYVYITISSIPTLLLLITLMMVMGPGLLQICIALAVNEWVGLARYLRGETLKHREKEYVMAARAFGVHPLRILQRHILPNVFHLIIISATLSFSGLILSEAILSFLGIGVPVGTGSWGLMISAAQMELAREPVVWWVLTSAAVALFGIVLAANIFGDAVRDALDPRLREG